MSRLLNSLTDSSLQSGSERPIFTILPLPWKRNDLVPFLSEKSITLHYDTYYREHVVEMNLLAAAFPELQSQTLPQIILTYPIGTPFNNTAAEILNHEFFFRCLSPNRSVPSGRLYQTIIQQFKSFEDFTSQFTDRVVNHFGSGWVWLVYDSTTSFLMIIDGNNAYNPILDGYIPLLALDIWEHSYYIDYATNKREYVNNFWNFVNWPFSEEIAAEQIFGYRVRVK
jgi:superoxide dismutase, Fe-Mn family